jgi:hypothetical protein
MPPGRTTRREDGVKLITFEAQSRDNRAWRTIGVFDDRLLAVAEAERQLEAKRTPAVRVVQVLYDPASTKCTEYTIFRATSFDEENEPARKRVPDQEMFEWGADGRDRDGEGEPPWIERHWPNWAPDWATSALAMSFAVLIASILFRWSK